MWQLSKWFPRNIETKLTRTVAWTHWGAHHTTHHTTHHNNNNYDNNHENNDNNHNNHNNNNNNYYFNDNHKSYNINNNQNYNNGRRLSTNICSWNHSKPTYRTLSCCGIKCRFLESKYFVTNLSICPIHTPGNILLQLDFAWIKSLTVKDLNPGDYTNVHVDRWCMRIDLLIVK